VARRHVADVMRHHTGQLRLFIRRQNHCGVHVKEPARQAESIDRFRIDYLAGERNLRIRIAPDVGWSVEQRYYRARHAL
jgi:hypothetical protein